MSKYINYQQQARGLAEAAVGLLNELNEEGIDTAYSEVLCRKLYKYGYIEMDGDEYVLRFDSNGILNIMDRRRKASQEMNGGTK